MNIRGDWNKACFLYFCFTDFIFKFIALKKLPVKLSLPIYISQEADFLFFVLSSKEKIVKFLSHLFFSTLWSVFFRHFQKSNSWEKSSFSCSFHWYLRKGGQIFCWFCEIFWSVKNHFSRYWLLKIFFAFIPVMSSVFILLAWNLHTWLRKHCWLTSDR